MSRGYLLYWGQHMTYLQELLTTGCRELFGMTVQPLLTRPEPQFGDYATNVALQLAKPVGQSPQRVAEQLKAYIESHQDRLVAKIEVAGPGFLNFFLTDQQLWQASQAAVPKPLTGQRVLLEYSCPNPFKELHAGHLYQTILGDTLGRLLSQAGATVYRANFGGDVGPHVAMCLWGIRTKLHGDHPEKLAAIPPDKRALWLSKAYVKGAKAFEQNIEAAEEIKRINAAVYNFHTTDDHQTLLAQIYWTCRDWSYDYFKQFYDQVNVAPFDKYYPESSTTPLGIKLVRDNIGRVFAESQGAVIFKGEDFDVHTRVFINSEGLPTYEAKDLGVLLTEYADFPYDRRIIITGNDQSEYMKVVFAALAQIDPVLAQKQTHLANGTVLFGDGKKMSSRRGNVLRGVDVLEAVGKAVEKSASGQNARLRQEITLGAVKYAFLKQRLGGDLAFDVQESVSLQGNSGPYLQYAHARAQSILRRGTMPNVTIESLEPDERLLVNKLSQFVEVVTLATAELMPHHICTYLHELAQLFNRFYEHNRVVGDTREAIRLQIVQTYARVLGQGLELLNIPAPERM